MTAQRRHPHKAVYWAISSVDEFGKHSFGSPQEIDVRWEDRAELFVDEMGQERRSRSIVYSEVSLAVRGYLYKGTAASLSGETDPLNVEGAFEIMQYDEISTIDGRKTMRKAWL